MVLADTVLRSIALGVKDTGFLPSKVTYATIELDNQGEHSSVDPPVLELTPVDVSRDRSRNTEFAGYVTNDQGEEIGRWYETWFTMSVEADLLTLALSDTDHRELTRQFRKAISVYDDHRLGRPLPDPDDSSSILDAITDFVEVGERPDNDFTTSPSIRRNQVTLDVQFEHEYSSVELDEAKEPIDSVTQNITVH